MRRSWEKLVVEALDGFGEVFSVYDEAEIHGGRSLRHHAHVDIVQGFEDARSDAGGHWDFFANQTDNSLVLIDRDFGELVQLADDLVQVRGLVNGERYADLRRGNHVDGSLVAVENFEDAAQESVDHKHASGADVQNGDVFLIGDGLHAVRGRNRFGDDPRAFDLGTLRVQDQDRDIFLDGGQHRGGGQYLGAKVRQFGCLREGDGTHAMAARADGGVTGEHAIDVGPDLDLLSANARAHDGGGEIRAAPAERSGDAVL